ncbi:MAG: hypothetical protein WD993_07220 [Thermoleophilaceae bacterium]
MERAWKFGLIALIALALTVLPGGGGALAFALTLLTIAFFTVIALLGYRLFRQYRMEIEGLADRHRAILYGSIGLAFLTLCATARLFEAGGVGALAWIALLALGSYGIYSVYVRYRAYG